MSRSFNLPRVPVNYSPRVSIELTRSQQMALQTLIADYMRTHGSIDVFVDCSTPGGVETRPEDLLTIIMEGKPNGTR